MNIKHRIWSPDTCKCVITMEMDADTQTEFVPVRSFVNKEGVETVYQICKVHDTGDLQTSYDACLKTNQTKNQLEGVFNSMASTRKTLSQSETEVLKLIKVATGEAMSMESAVVPTEIRHKEYKWTVGKNGEVEIDLSTFSAQEKADLETEINNTLIDVVIK